jgi:hypothetical protein
VDGSSQIARGATVVSGKAPGELKRKS